MNKSSSKDILCCPKCLGCFDNNNNKSQLICANCQAIYRLQDDGQYYDFYIADENITSPTYPKSLGYLHYNREKILSIVAKNTIIDTIFNRKDFNDNWERELIALQKNVRAYNLSERNRVEYMIDDDTTQEYKNQQYFTEVKSKIIMRYISSVKHNGNKVLHIGCGGKCNESIPIKYSNNKFINYGVEAVRSYVNEFSKHGEAHLANALSLPYQDESFSVINFTDILEHLFDPLLGLVEANRVLKQGGYLILDTPNQNNIRSYKNPLIWAEHFIAQIFPKISRKKIITGGWGGEVFFHTEFTKNELVSLLTYSGFSIKRINIHSTGNNGDNENEMRSIKKIIKSFFNYIAPIGSWFVLAEKVSHTNRN